MEAHGVGTWSHAITKLYVKYQRPKFQFRLKDAGELKDRPKMNRTVSDMTKTINITGHGET